MDEYISKKEAIIAVTRDGCTANVVGVLYHLPTANVVPRERFDHKFGDWFCCDIPSMVVIFRGETA